MVWGRLCIYRWTSHQNLHSQVFCRLFHIAIRGLDMSPSYKNSWGFRYCCRIFPCVDDVSKKKNSMASSGIPQSGYVCLPVDFFGNKHVVTSWENLNHSETWIVTTVNPLGTQNGCVFRKVSRVWPSFPWFSSVCALFAAFWNLWGHS